MTRNEFLKEFSGILNLLRDHSFLLYSPNGSSEYGEKVQAAVRHFIYLVYQETGFSPAIPDYRAIPIERITDATWPEVLKLAKRAETYYRSHANDLNAKPFLEAADAWALVLKMLRRKKI